jgi:hypothetical protein
MALARDALLRRTGRLIRLMGVRRVNPISFDRRRHGIDPQALHHAIADQPADDADRSPGRRIGGSMDRHHPPDEPG